MLQPKSKKDIEYIEKDIKSKQEKPTQFSLDSARNRLQAENSAQSFFDGATTNEFAFKNYNVPIEQAYTKLNSGEYIRKFENFIPGTNNEERLARQQSSGEKWANGFTKLAGKTGTAILGGTVGVVNGIINGIKEGSLSATYNNDFNKWLDDLNTKMDYKLPNYYTEQEKNAGFLESMGTANFWANDVTEGLSFTLGTIVSEGIWAYATGGTSLIAKGGLGWGTRALSKTKALSALDKSKEIGKTILRASEKEAVDQAQKAALRGIKVTRLANNARFLVTSAGYEAGVEARFYMKSTEENWENSFKELNGRPPSAEERKQFKDSLEGIANNVFAANVGLVGASNLAMFGKILKGTPINQTIENNWFKNKIFGIGYKTVDGKKVALEATRKQKFARGAYSFGKYGLLEGVVEEGGQGVISGAGESFMLNTFDSKNTEDSFGIMESVIDGFVDSYGTKEGRKSIGIGFIVGLFGGAVATKGRFNELSSEQKAIAKEVEFSNTVTSELLYNRLKEANRIQEATKKDDGTYYGGAMSKKEAIYSRVIRDIRIGGLEAGFKDLQAYLEKTTDTEIAESIGVEVTDKETIKTYKQSILSEYQSVAEDTKKNLSYAEAVLGDSKIAGLNDINVKELAEAVAYTLTMGKQSDMVSDSIAENIKQIVADRLGTDASGAVSLENTLRKISDKKLKDYKRAAKKVELKQERVNQIQNRIVDVQNINNKEDNTARANQLASLNKALIEETANLEKLQQEKQLAFDVSNIANLSNGEVTMDMLDKQKEVISKLKNSLDALSLEDKELVNILTSEYERAVVATKQYNNTIAQLTNPKTRVNLLNGWLSSFINKNKKLNEGLDQYFREVLDRYQTAQKQTAVFSKTQAEQKENYVAAEEEQVEKKPEIKTPIQSLEDKIREMVKERPYLLEYVGDDISERSVIDKKDVDRYQELLKEIKNPQEILNNPTDFLTDTEKEFVKLNKKLNNWKTLDGSGVGSYLLLLKNLKSFEAKQGTSTKSNPSDLIYVTQGNQSQGSGATSLSNVNTVQSPSNKVAKYNKDEGTYEISHTNLDSLKEIVGGRGIIEVEGKALGEVSEEDKKKIGTKFTIKVGDLTVKGVVSEYNRLSIKKEDLDKLLQESDVSILDTGVSNFMPLYKNGQPLRGDFTFISNDGSLINFNEDATYDLNSGDVLVTEISFKDAYNSKLLQDYKSGKITMEELGNQLVIYMKPKTNLNTIVGTLRKLSEKNSPSPSVSALKEIRSRAVKEVLNSKEESVDLQINIPIKKVLVGNPNFVSVQQGDSLVPDTIDFNGDSVSAVVATGYAINGSVKINKEINFNPAVAKRMSEREQNKNKKIPVVVFKYRNTNIAFPVDLIEADSTVAQRANTILNTDMDSIEKGALFVNTMIAAGVNPNQYNIDFTELGWENSAVVDTILNDLDQIKDFANVEDWLSPDYNPTNLIGEAKISVDITGRPLMAGKIIVQLENRTPYDQRVAKQKYKNKLEEDRIELVKDLSDEVIELEQLFHDSSDLSNKDADSEFLTAMYDKDVVKNPETYIDYAKNTSILTEMFSHKIPRAVAKRIGKEKIASIKQRLDYLEKLRERENTAPTTVPALTEEEKYNLSLSLLGTPYETVEDLYPVLVKAFYSTGVFNPSIESITNSGLYSQSEAVMIMENDEALRSIETLILQLELNEEEIKRNGYSDPRFLTVGTELDIIGKLKQDNPYVNEQEAVELLGGIKDREEFENALSASSLEYLKEVYDNTKGNANDLFLYFSSFDRAIIKEIVDGNLVEKTDSNKEYLEEVLTEPFTNRLQISIDKLLGLSEVTVEGSEEEIQVLVDEVLDNTVDIGLDLSELKGKSYQELKPLLEAIADFAQFQDQDSFNALVTEYDKQFSKGEGLNKVVTVPQEVSGRKGITYVKTDLADHQMYEKYGLLKVADGIYLEVAEQSLEELYNNIYSNKDNIPTKTKSVVNKVAINKETIAADLEADSEIVEMSSNNIAERKNKILEKEQEQLKNSLENLQVPKLNVKFVVSSKLSIKKEETIVSPDGETLQREVTNKQIQNRIVKDKEELDKLTDCYNGKGK